MISLTWGQLIAAPFTEWTQRQAVDVSAAGLVKLALPPATQDALRPGLEDLRITDTSGNEIPVLIQRPVPEPPAVRPAKSFQPTLRPAATTLLIETGLNAALNAVTLESPERDFIKAVRVEGSRDGQSFTLLLDGAPIFRQGAVSELTVRLPAGTWSWLRLTLDDQRSRPVPFTGARVSAASGEEAQTELFSVPIKSREDAGGETQLVLDLGAANLMLATLEFETTEGLFQREVFARVPELAGEEIHETEVARGTIYSVNTGTGTTMRRLTLTLDRQIRSRELMVLIRNFDSPPLAISAVRARHRPVLALFQARQAGTHFLYAGNHLCSAPRYDLAALAQQLRNPSGATLIPGALAPNPDFRQPETLPGLAETGAALDTSPWRFRKAVQLSRAGPQQLELDLDVLARARDDLADLRLVREAKQVPYLIQRTSITRALTLSAEPASDPKRPRLSRWKIKLPRPNLPVTRLECRPRTTLFQRSVRVWEEVPDGRGGKLPRELGGAEWLRTMDSKDLPLNANLVTHPQTETVLLETDNGENPPLELDNFRVFHSVSRVVFKATEAPMLYYGNPLAVAPHYDLSLVAPKLLAAEKASAVSGAEETLRKASWSEGEPLAGLRGWAFWGMLTLVVVGLMVVIVRLLPKPPDAGAGGKD